MKTQPDINAIKQQQTDLQMAGFYTGKIDGIWGPLSQTAMTTALAARAAQQKNFITNLVPPDFRQIPWGAKVSQLFKERVQWIASELLMPDEGAGWLMSCMAWESNQTFSASVANMAGSGAVGLIQFMPKTAIGLGTTVEALAKMTAEDQLNYVYKYFLPFKGKLNNLSDVYMTILYPIAVGKPESFVLFSKATQPIAYRQNSGLDLNHDSYISKSEAASKVADKLKLGMNFLG